MPLYVRKNNLWRNITFNVPAIAFNATLTDQSSNRLYLDISKSASEQAARKYTNNTGKLMLVRAVPGIDIVARNLLTTDISGSFSIAYVDDQEVSRIRDNGTNSADKIRFETQFFVPKDSEYYIKCYKEQNSTADSNTWQGDQNGGPIVDTIEWVEITFD